MTVVDGGGLPAGTQLNGIYEIVRRIGKGGMGEVYVAREIHSGNQVAIKMILPEVSHDQLIIDLFRREASTLNKLRHEAIVSYSVFSVDPHLKRPYLAMEFAYGPSLRERLRRGRPLTPDEFDTLQWRIASGLDVAHRAGIIHRDMSPDNIILIDDNVERAKIIDFGIAKSVNSEKTLLGDDFAGKMGYASPEQVGLSGSQVSEKSDVYALGLVFAEALTAKSMNMGGSHAEVVEKRRKVPDLSNVPEDYRPLIAWMLDPDPAKRPTMSEVAAWQAGDDLGDSGGGIGRTLLRVAGGLSALALIGVVAWFFLTGQTQLDPANPGHVTAAEAQVGAPYTWRSPAFVYSGDPAELTLAIDGDLPPGITFNPGKDGTGTFTGTPVQAADTVVEIEAEAPDGTRAVQSVVFRIVAPPNRPPSVVKSVTAAILLQEGEPVNLQLGTFEDDGGAAGLVVAVDGRLPNGLTFNAADGGIAQIYGTAGEVGTFAFDIVATDAQGAAARFPVNLKISGRAPDPVQPYARTRDYIARNNRTGCFFTRAEKLGDRSAELESFAAEEAPIRSLDAGFKSDLGFEAKISGHIISGQQCRVIDRFAALDASMFEHDVSVSIPNDVPTAGELFKGIVANGAKARLFLVNDQGRPVDLAAESVAVAGDLEFQTRLYGRGPQLIVAAVPAAPGALAGATSFDDIVNPGMRGRVRLAIGYVVVR